MSKTALFIRYIFFCLFFAVGAGSMTLSFLAPELRENYESIDELKHTEVTNKKLQLLNDTYERQIEMAKSDPEMLKRLQQKILGTGTFPEDAAFPQASEGLIKLARKALAETEKTIVPATTFRKYIEHSAEKRNRLGLFYSGAALILITFIFFGTPKKQKTESATKDPAD